MSRIVGSNQRYPQAANVVGTAQCQFSTAWRYMGTRFFALLIALATPIICHADSQTGTTHAGASLDFRIVIPAMIIVSAVTQLDRIVIENRHIAQGYIDLDASTLVKITNNSRNGYLLTARYDAQLLTSVEVRILGQNLTASSGVGSMCVNAGIATDKLVPISYRLHLASGVRVGDYRWPVALAFSLASV